MTRLLCRETTRLPCSPPAAARCDSSPDAVLRHQEETLEQGAVRRLEGVGNVNTAARCVHADRADGGTRDHRNSDGGVNASRAVGAGRGAVCELPKSAAAACTRTD